MSYCTLYQCGKPRPDPNFIYTPHACFSGMYGNVMSQTEVEVIVLKKYASNFTADMRLTSEEINKYYNLLRDCEFVFTLEEGTRKYSASSIKDQAKETDCYIFNIKIQANSRLVNLIILNAIRYLYESDYYKMVKDFIELCEYPTDISIFNRFLLAHSIVRETVHSGHCLLQSNSEVKRYYSDKDFVKLILQAPAELPKDKEGYAPVYYANYLLRSLHYKNAMSLPDMGNIKRDMQAAMKEKDFKTLFNIYGSKVVGAKVPD